MNKKVIERIDLNSMDYIQTTGTLYRMMGKLIKKKLNPSKEIEVTIKLIPKKRGKK